MHAFDGKAGDAVDAAKGGYLLFNPDIGRPLRAEEKDGSFVASRIPHARDRFSSSGASKGRDQRTCQPHPFGRGDLSNQENPPRRGDRSDNRECLLTLSIFDS